MTFVGMDPQEVQRVADGLRARGQELEGLVDQVDASVQHAGAVWPGPDSDAFRDAWFDLHRTALLSAATETLTRAAWLSAQVTEQREVSGPGASGAGPGVCVDPTHVSDGELLGLSRAAYADAGDVGDWQRLSDDELRDLGIDPALLNDPASGFAASVFRDADGNLVVAFRGTTEWVEVRRAGADVVIGPGKDLTADAAGATYLSRQGEQAVALALAVQVAAGDGNVVFTGHSLGGRLAALASIATGDRAVTFNAAGPSSSEMMFAHIAGGGESPSGLTWLAAQNPFDDGNADAAYFGIDVGNITNHRADDDPLSALQAHTPVPDAIGHQVVHDINAPDPVAAHSLDILEPFLVPPSSGGGGGGGGGGGF